MKNKVTLVDAGTGNLRSVQKALESLGANVLLTNRAEDVLRSEKAVLPGVGAYGDFMAGLKARGLVDAIREAVRRGIPLLGICVGMQAMFDVGEEMGSYPGLGLLRGQVCRFPPLGELKVPHTGWNQLVLEKSSPLWRGIASGDYVYFNHAYYCAPGTPDEEIVIASTDYGIRIATALQYNNLFGVQFHPEKSQRVGLQILANFLAI